MSPSLEPGVVLTPPALARRLVDSLPPSAADRVLDPACGEGALLLAALEARGNDPSFARSALFGFELDATRAERAREVLRAAAGLPAGTELDQHIVTGDALELPWPDATDVLANPPWVSFSGRQAIARPKSASSLGGWPSMHGLFLERIAQHVHTQQSSAAILLPSPVGFSPSYAPLRKRVEELAHLAAPVIELGEDAFAGVTEPSMLLTLVAGSATNGSSATWIESGTNEQLERFAHFPRLPRGTFADPGVHTGNSASELISESPAPGHIPIRRGRDLRAFELDAPQLYLRTDLEPTGERRFRLGKLDRFEEFPVLLRQTAKRPIAALHEPVHAFRNSLLGMRRVDGLEPAFCVAVLNSETIAEFHRTAQRDAQQKNFPQVKVGHLEALPFPIAHRDEARAEHDAIVELVHSVHCADETLEIEARVQELFSSR